MNRPSHTATPRVPAVMLTDAALKRARDLVEWQVLATARPTTLETLVADLTTPDATLLSADRQKPETALAAALATLVGRGEVVAVPGGYVTPQLPTELSRRLRTLSLCGRAAVAHGRAVLSTEVWHYAQAHAAADVAVGGLDQAKIVGDLASLVSTGDAVVVALARGGSSVGTKLMVPASFVTIRPSWEPTEPLTWLDYVAAAITRMLSTTSSGAFTTDQLRSFLQRDVRDGVAAARHGSRTDLARPTTVTFALRSLAAAKVPFVRPVVGRRAVWTLVANNAEQAPVAEYANDTDRLVEAARRVTIQSGRPVVTPGEVLEVLEGDAALALSNGTSVAAALSDLAKECVYVGRGRRVNRRTQRLRRVGVLGGSAAYWVATGSDDDERMAAALRLVETRGLLDEVVRGRYAARVAEMDAAASPVIATGRARQLLQEIQSLQDRVRALPRQSGDIESHLRELEAHEGTLRAWLQFRASRAAAMPIDVRHNPSGLTGVMLQELFAPINSVAASYKSNGKVIAHYCNAIRRIPNPQFVGRRSGDPGTAAKFLFDQVDAYGYAARNWGGPKCQLHALWAIEELGDLRDARYVLAALTAGAASVRQRVIGILALLQPPEARAVLTRHARNDVDPGVRECALWALGMLLGDEAGPMLQEAATRDPEAAVRRTAASFLGIGRSWWWRA